MAGSTRRLAALGLAGLLTQGCVTGHLFEAARRREQPLAVHEAWLLGDRLVVGYTALVTDALGHPLGREERQAAIPLVALRRGDLAPDAFPLEWLASEKAGSGPLLPLSSGGGPAPSPPFLQVEERPDRTPMRLILHEADATIAPPFPANALTRTSTAVWVYPLLPLSLPVDAVVDPVGFLFLPIWVAIGD